MFGKLRKYFHVNTSTTPQRSCEDHIAVAVGHVAHVPTIVAHVEGPIVAALTHPGVGLRARLEVGDGEGVVSVDGATVEEIVWNN